MQLAGFELYQSIHGVSIRFLTLDCYLTAFKVALVRISGSKTITGRVLPESMAIPSQSAYRSLLDHCFTSAARIALSKPIARD